MNNKLLGMVMILVLGFVAISWSAPKKASVLQRDKQIPTSNQVQVSTFTVNQEQAISSKINTKPTTKVVQPLVVQPRVIQPPSPQELKLGINLQSLPVKGDYQVSFFSDKGLPATNERITPYTPAAEGLPTEGIERVRYVIENLLKGPTDEEKKQGYISYIPDGTKLVDCKFLVDEFGVKVYLEFSEDIVKDIDEMNNTNIQTQIMYTLISLEIPKLYGTKVMVKGKSLGYYMDRK